MAQDKSGFLEELKRRHVWRVAVAYAVSGWLLVQIATQVFPIFHMPDWIAQLVVLLVVLGFPVAVIFAWVYEITPEGVRRTVPTDSPDARPEYASRQIGRKLNAVIIAVLVLAVALLGWRLLVLRHAGAAPKTIVGVQAGKPDAAHRNPGATSPGSTAGAAPSGFRNSTGPAQPAAFHPAADTLVVLPFTNLNDDPKQQYFSDGITEELTNALGRNTALRVVAWNTASTFRDPGQTATDIGKRLNVAYLLHGSIRREGAQVRVTTELVDTVTGFQIWAEHYDQPFKNIFAVQDKITASISNALEIKFAQADRPAGGTHNPEAHELVLKGRALLEQHDVASYSVAQQDFEQAIKLDPDYADAYAALAGALFDQTDYSDLSLKDTGPKVRVLAQKALALDPRNADALVVLGNLDANELKPTQAQDEYRQALALDPSNAHAHVDYALTLSVTAALAEIREAVLLDPRSWVAHMNLALTYAYLGDYSQMLVPAQAIFQLSPGNVDGAFLLAFAYRQLHQQGAAAKAFDLAKPVTPLDRLQAQAGRLTYQSLLDPALRPQAVTAVESLGRAKLSPYSQRNLIQLYLALGETAPALQRLESLCPSFPVACSDLTIFPLFQALRNDPRFEKLSQHYTTRAQLPIARSSGSAEQGPR